MVVKAAVVEVDGAHHRLPVVADKHLRVDKAGGVLVNLDPRIKQGGVVSFRQGVGGLFIRHAGQDQAHIHPPLGRKAQGGLHLAVQNQIGRHDVDIPLGPVQNVHIDPLAHLVFVQRAVPVGHHPAPGLLAGGRGHAEKAGELRLLFGDRPHLQKHQGKALHRLALEHHGGVLPVAVLFDHIDILIRQIDPAVEGGVPVDHQNFAVVAVVVVGGDKGGQRREHPARDAQLVQPFGVVVRQGGKFAGAVVHHTHLHPLGGLAGQDLQHPAPHQPLLDDEVLQKDEPFGPFQLAQQLGPLFLPGGKIGDLGAPKHRLAAAALHIPAQPRRAGVFLF